MRIWKIFRRAKMVETITAFGSVVWKYVRRVPIEYLWTHQRFRIGEQSAQGRAHGAAAGQQEAELGTVGSLSAEGAARSAADGRAKEGFTVGSLAIGEGQLRAVAHALKGFIVSAFGFGEARSSSGSYGRAGSLFRLFSFGEHRQGIRHEQKTSFGKTEGKTAAGTGNTAAGSGTESSGALKGELAYGFAWLMPKFNEQTGTVTIRQVQTMTANGDEVTIS